MTTDELEAAIRITGVERYRYLCTEHPDEAVREGYRRLVREIAAGRHDPRIPAAPAYDPSWLPGPCGGCR